MLPRSGVAFPALALLLFGMASVLNAGCGDDDDDGCNGGDCVCHPGESCSFDCAHPPCHVDCEGDTCTGTCANGDCRCAAGGACEFSCLAPPCHVACEGDNPSCDGACANGTCTCAAGSECAFTCLDHNCAVVCDAGSGCTLSCPEGNPGTQGCNIDCGAGSVTSCADGSLACGMPCPA